MRLSDLDLEVGERYTSDRLQSVFDRGMTGRGIEICYDSDDRRYLRLFARGDGPYADKLSGDEFTYVGEGQSGDQELTAGNRYLAEAKTAPLPIFFFYKPSGGDAWEYRGRVEVLAFDRVRRNGRRVFEFTLTYDTKERVDRSSHASDISPPKRVETRRSRVIRDTQISSQLKEEYRFECQICGDVRRQSPSEGYAEAHHVRPLGSPHDGPDVRSNLIVVCPNHHADFDYGMLSIDPESGRIAHAYDQNVDGTTLETRPDHEIDPKFLRYHNHEIADF
ncbi:HNH endonuclease [Halorubrum sp. F4]|uniref:HNH endonuclease n=1 Tax=Halorubrum sp. F4 TaxID=2989715 RepID=UPI002480D0A1|nr:HNH endonuclease [Halorubrum sp. F4]